MQKTMGELKTSSPMASGEASVSSSGYQTAAVPVAALPPKKKRNLPGMPGKSSIYVYMLESSVSKMEANCDIV